METIKHRVPEVVPQGIPFRFRDARQWGLSQRKIYGLEEQGLLRRMLHGVLVTSDTEDSVVLRTRALELVLPPGGVVTDSTAAWLHGVLITPRRGPDSPLPPITCFSREESRLRRGEVASGIRALLDRDVQRIGGLWVTSPLRTACDVGRLVYRFDALGVLDAFAARGLPAWAIERETARFKGMRGVVQLRALTGIIDAGSESPGESALRLHWHESGLPDPVVQHWVRDGSGREVYRLDLADPRVKYAAEYDGEQWHGPEHEQRDRERRRWLDRQGWTVDVFSRTDVFGRQNAPSMLQAGHRRAIERMRGRTWSGDF